MAICERENELKNASWLVQSRKVSDWREANIDVSFGRSCRGKGALDKDNVSREGK
jgi:hypothetical protein